MSTDGGLHSNASSPGEEAVGGLVSDFEAVSHRRTPLHVAFTPPVETFCARRFGVDSKGLPLAKKPDGDVSDLEWIRPGSAEDRQKIVARSRRPTSVPSLQYDSCPSHDDVGGFFFEFECSAQVQKASEGSLRYACLCRAGDHQRKTVRPRGGHVVLRRHRLHTAGRLSALR